MRQQNSGPAAARNKGIHAARGEYILFINDDTLLAPAALAAHLQAHQEKGQSKISVLGTFVYVPEAQQKPFVYFLEQTDIVFAYPLLKPGNLYNYRFFWTCNLSIRRQALFEAGLFDEDFAEPMVEDTELGYRLEKLGYGVLYYPAAQAQHDHSMDIHSFMRRQEMSGRNVVKLFKKHPELLPQEKKLFGFENLAEPTLQRFRAYLKEHQPVVVELVQKFDEIEQLSIEKLQTIQSNRNGKTGTAADEFVEWMKTGIWPIHFYNFYRGILQAVGDPSVAAFPPPESLKSHPTSTLPAIPEDRSINFLKILFVMYGWDDDGGGTILPRQMARALAQRGHQVTVIYAAAQPYADKPAYYLREHWEDGVHLFGIYNRQSLFLDSENPDREVDDPAARQIVSQIIQRIEPDVVHYHNLLGLSMGIAADVAQMGIPSLYTSHNYWPICPRLYLFQNDLALCHGPSSDGRKCAACIGRLEKQHAYVQRMTRGRQMLNQDIDRHLAISTRARQLFVENGFEAERIHVLHQSTQMVDQVWSQVGQNRTPVSALKRPLRVGFLGSLLPHKGPHILVEAIQRFDKSEIEGHFWGTGPAHYLQNLNSLDQKQLVKFYGAYEPDQLVQILRQVDLTVIPSIWEEGAGLVIVEALAARVPVIGSRIGGIPDFIQPGQNGFLFEPGNVEDLVRQLRQFIDTPDLLGRLQAQIRPSQEFQAFLDELLGHYRDVISANRGSLRKSSALPEPAAQPLNRIQFDQNLAHGFSNQPATGQLPQPLPDPLYLNLGCGKDIRAGFVNIDLFNDDPGVVGMDVRHLDLPDNCADGIIASDILEHFSHREIDPILSEWARVLKPGGELAIRTPSLRLQAKAYLNGVWDADVASYMIFGGQTNPGDYHCVGFDEQSIRKHLNRVGLEVFFFEEEDTPQSQGFINLNMTVRAKKPVPVNLPPVLSPSATPTNLPTVIWEGSQFVTHSLALINREQCLQLIDSGYDVSIIPYEPDQFGPEVDPRFVKLARRINAPLARPADVHVRHQWPPQLTPPPEGHWVVIQPWEFGSLPKDWVNVFRTQVDEMWVPSNYVRDCYIRSGIPAGQVFVVPNGIDTARFRPDMIPYPLKTNKHFKFLFVGGTIQRKGVDVLLKAYTRAFSAADDVCLVIKDMGGQSFYQGRTSQTMIDAVRQQPNAPEIEYFDSTLSDEQLAGLYTACDCLVHPYRGEGFGLPIAEAMACGLPVIVTGYGAALDFCNEENAYLIPAQVTRFPEKRIGERETVDYPWWAEPDPAALVDLLRQVFTNPNEAGAKGQMGMAHIRAGFTWTHVGQVVARRLEVLRRKPVLRHMPKTTALLLAATATPEPKQLKQCLTRLDETLPTPQPSLTLAGASTEIVRHLDDPDAGKPVLSALKTALESGANYVVLLTTDVIPTPGWIDALLAVAQADHTLAAVGPVANAAPKIQQIKRNYQGIHKDLADFAAIRAQEYGAQWQAAPYLGGFCLLFKTHAVRVVGGVNDALPLPDALLDLYSRLQNFGFKLAVAPGVYVHHKKLSADEGANYDAAFAARQKMAEALAPGQEALNRNDLETAAREFAIAAQRHPGLVEAHAALGNTLLALNRLAEAVEPLRRAAALAPHEVILPNQLGLTLYQLNRLAEAETAFKQATQTAPNQPEAYLYLTDLYQQQKRYQEAIQAIKHALELAPDKVEVLVVYGLLMLELDDVEGAEMAWNRLAAAPSDHPGVMALLNGLAAKGSALLNTGDLLDQVETAQAAGNYPQAISLLKSALVRGRPAAGKPDLWNRLGVCYAQAGNLAEATSAFESGLSIAPDNLDILNNLAGLYYQQEMFDRATEYINQALHINPNHVDTLMLLGNCAIQLEAFDVALLAFRSIRELVPDAEGINEIINELSGLEIHGLPEVNGNGRNGTAEVDILELIKAVDSAQAAHDWPTSIDLLKQAIRLAQGSAEVEGVTLWNRLGFSRFMLGQFDEAESAFLTALEIDSNNFEALSNLANLYLQQERFDQATGYLNQALAINPEDVNVLLTLGNCSIQLGAFDTALLAFRRVQALAPQTGGIDEIINQLEAVAANSMPV
ncbi:MAG: glycosyltransferase [Chloroflexota bacterium]